MSKKKRVISRKKSKRATSRKSSISMGERLKNTAIGAAKGVALAAAINTGVGIYKNNHAMKAFSTNQYKYQHYPNQNKIKNIEGIFSVSHYYNVAGKEIYLFGDTHIKGEKCSNMSENTLTIPRVFDLIIKYNPQIPIDFFVEIHYSEKMYHKLFTFLANMLAASQGNNFMSDTRAYFKVCGSKSICKKYWPNLRYHGTDIRMTKLGGIFELLLSRTLNENYIRNLWNKYIENKDEMYRIFKIKKQLDNISDERVKTAIKESVDEQMDQVRIAYNRSILYRPQLMQSYLFLALTLVMDYYTLGRIFRSFSDHESKYVMIYVGDLHRASYTRVFDKLSTGRYADKYGNQHKYRFDQGPDPTSNDSFQFHPEKQCTKLYSDETQDFSNLPAFESAPPVSEEFSKERDMAFRENDFSILDRAYENYYKHL